MRGSWIAIGAAALLACAAVLWVLLDGSGAEDEAAGPATAGEPAPPAGDRGAPDEQPAPEPESDDPQTNPGAAELERRAARGARRAYRRYVAAIDAADGRALCRSVVGNPAAELRVAVRRGSCAQRLAGSIGYEDPRGFPVWEETTLAGVDRVTVGSDVSVARVTATVVTRFRDRTEPSIESDIAYLADRGGAWILLKPTAALYRAVGKPEPPPSVISPPPGFEL